MDKHGCRGREFWPENMGRGIVDHRRGQGKVAGRSRFDYRYPDSHPVLVSPDTVIILPISSTRYRHLVLDDGYQIIVEFGCGTRC